mgnify:CR=1 FL=1
MMEVVLSNQSRKFLTKLHDKKYKERLFEVLGFLSVDPVPHATFDLEKMGGMENTYRLRKGDFRIVYNFNKNTNIVYVIEITRREQAYK